MWMKAKYTWEIYLVIWHRCFLRLIILHSVTDISVHPQQLQLLTTNLSYMWGIDSLGASVILDFPVACSWKQIFMEYNPPVFWLHVMYPFWHTDCYHLRFSFLLFIRAVQTFPLHSTWSNLFSGLSQGHLALTLPSGILWLLARCSFPCTQLDESLLIPTCILVPKHPQNPANLGLVNYSGPCRYILAKPCSYFHV